MKMRILRDKQGKVIASINQTPEDTNHPPLNMEAEDGGQEEEIEVQPRDLLNIDKLLEQASKK